ncbi:MAG: alpha/beta hydrolase [archaeon]
MIKGEGQNLVLIPGWKSDLERMNDSIQMISKYYRVHTLDLPGTGGTEGIKKFTIVEYAKFTAKWIKKLKITDFIIGAVSMGGQILTNSFDSDYVKKNAKGVLLIFPMYGINSLKMNKLSKTGLRIGTSLLWRRPFCHINDRIFRSKRIMRLIVKIFEQEKDLKTGDNLEHHVSHFKRFSARVSMQSIHDALKVHKTAGHYMIPALLIMAKDDPLIDFDIVMKGYKKVFPKLRAINLPGKIHSERRKVSPEAFEKIYSPVFRQTKRIFKWHQP